MGVGAVVWRENKVLLVRRGKPPRESEWSLPGGAQHTGETVREACVREVREETQLTVSVGPLLDVIDGIFRDPNGKVRHHYTLIDFEAEWTAGEAAAADDVVDVRWAAVSELGKLDLWQQTERIIRDSAVRRGVIDLTKN